MRGALNRGHLTIPMMPSHSLSDFPPLISPIRRLMSDAEESPHRAMWRSMLS